MADSWRSGVVAPAADAAAVVLFAAVGRRSHAESSAVLGALSTAWPFLAGCAAGWALARGWRRPATSWSTALVVWPATVVGGMLLRAATGGGTPWSFVLVAGIVLGLLLLGWRALARLAGRRRARVAAGANAS